MLSRSRPSFSLRRCLRPNSVPRTTSVWSSSPLAWRLDSRTIITYFVGADKPMEEVGMKLRILPVEWFYSEGIP